ncbi:hypothetical protein QBC44DRAFT_314836 [Cladorrhinum sp. PSN332]|nr:hypothetical protein QBC44DRAFT_314836 [Cladorrhinum sp. PSN332]
MNSFSRTLSAILGLILFIGVDFVLACQKGNSKSAATNATYSGYSALTQDCINLADRFAYDYSNQNPHTDLTYTADNGLVSFPTNGTCQFLLKVSPGSKPVVINFSDISYLIAAAATTYNTVIDGKARVGAVGNYDCPEDRSEATWWLDLCPYA